MAQICRPAKCIEAVRVSLLDDCTFLPLCGPLNGYAMGCIIDAEWSPEIEEGDESIVKSDCGSICLTDNRCDLIKRWNLEFKIKGPDEEFLALIGGDNLIVDGGLSVGVQHLNAHCSPYLFIELFERTEDCVAGAPVYFRHVFPAARLTWTGNEREGIFRILQIEGKTRSVLIDNIGDGPYGDIPDYATIAPIGARTDYFWFEDTTVPVVQCGSIPVPCDTPPPTVAGASSPECETFEITGTGFLGVNQIHIEGTFPEDYYNPAGPDFALNPVTATINTWTDTLISITDTNLAGQTITSVHFFPAGGSPPADATVDLGTADSYATLAGTTITNTGFTVLDGDLGLHPGSSVVGFPPGIVNGVQEITTAAALAAKNDLTTAYLDAAGRSSDFALAGNIGGLTLAPGVHTNAGAVGLTGNVTLDAGGNPNAVFIFQIGSTLITDSGSSVSLIDGAQACNVFWQVGSSATLGSGSEFAGNILALTSITADTGATVDGRLLARNGAATLDDDAVTVPVCDLGTFDFADFLVADCPPAEPPPTIESSESPACAQFSIVGTGFDTVNHIELLGTAPLPIDYYDPAGPDAGLNPGTSTIIQWTSTQIYIEDTQLVGSPTFTSVHLWGLADSPDFGIFDLVDAVIEECPTPGIIESEETGPANVFAGVQVDKDTSGNYYVASAGDDGVGGDRAVAVWKVGPTGLPDGGFGPNGVEVVPGLPTDSWPTGLVVDSSAEVVYVLAHLNGGTDVAVLALDIYTGALFAGFGTGGIFTVAASVGTQFIKQIFLESTGNIVVGWNTTGGVGNLSRITPAGVLVDTVAFPAGRSIVGAARNNADGLYAVAGYDPGTGFSYVGTADIGAATVTLALIAPNMSINVLAPVAVDPVSGDIYIGGNNVAATDAVVARFTSALAVDATWGGTGQVSIQTGSWLAATATDVALIAAGGDVIVSGFATTGGEWHSWNARFTTLGVLVPTYGTAGIEEYALPPNANTVAYLYDTYMEALTAVHTGTSDLGGGDSYAWIMRTLLSDGSLDPTFT